MSLKVKVDFMYFDIVNNILPQMSAVGFVFFVVVTITGINFFEIFPECRDKFRRLS